MPAMHAIWVQVPAGARFVFVLFLRVGFCRHSTRTIDRTRTTDTFENLREGLHRRRPAVVAVVESSAPLSVDLDDIEIDRVQVNGGT